MPKSYSAQIYPVITAKEPYKDPLKDWTYKTNMPSSTTSNPQPNDSWDTYYSHSSYSGSSYSGSSNNDYKSSYKSSYSGVVTSSYKSSYSTKRKQPKFTVEIIEEEKWLS